jgi:type IV pilus assembly protein PilM
MFFNMILSIDVGSDSFFAVEGSYAGGTVDVVKTAEMKFPIGTVEDGTIKKHAAFIMALNKMIVSKRFKTNSAVFTFNSNAILSRRLDLPASKPKDMLKMVKNEMLQVVNEANDYVFEYSIVNDNVMNASVKSVWAYAIPREIVDEYYSIFRNIKLKPVALDTHPNSVEKLFLNSVVNGRPIGGESVLFVNIEDEYMEIHLFSDGQLNFSRITPISSSELATLLGKSGQVGAGSVFDTLDITADQFANDNILSDASRQYINGLADELQKMIQFQLRRDAVKPVTTVYIYGGMACIRGLAAGIGAALGIPTENVETVSKLRSQDFILAKYINAIGALIRL